MKTNKITLSDLRSEHKKNYNTKCPDNKSLLSVVTIINNNSGFREYLSSSCFDYYELPYAVFGELATYIKDMLLNDNYSVKNDKTTELQTLLRQLNDMATSGDIDIETLVAYGFLEGLASSISTNQQFYAMRSILQYESLHKEFDEIKKRSRYT